MAALVASLRLPPSSRTASTPPTNYKLSFSGEKEEQQVVDEILTELVLERQRRAELEVRVEELKKELKATKKRKHDEVVLPRKHYTALQTELEGYRQLVEAMTSEKPAVAVALRSTLKQKIFQKHYNNKNRTIPPSLPLHVIRLLEVMPWDPRALEYAFATEELYEWQFFDAKQLTWASDLRWSPKCIRMLPMEEPQAGLNANGSPSVSTRKLALPFLVGVEVIAPPSTCILTDQRMTKRYDLTKGYPLPENGGTWQWVGGWRVEKRMDMCNPVPEPETTSSTRVDCDDEGWSYAMDAEDFLLNPTHACWDNAGKTNINGRQGVLRPIRRRKWTRQRSLVDYPHASECTKAFLHLMAKLTGATMAAHKISEQLVETKVSLTEAESVTLQCKDELNRQVYSLKQVLESSSLVKATPKDAMSSLHIAFEAVDKLQVEVLSLLDSAKNS